MIAVDKGNWRRPSVPGRMAIYLLRQYKRWISPWLGSVCRFYPSCSVYAIDVISSFGFFRGSWLALKRLMKCHPFNPGGIDFPPKPSQK